MAGKTGQRFSPIQKSCVLPRRKTFLLEKDFPLAAVRILSNFVEVLASPLLAFFAPSFSLMTDADDVPTSGLTLLAVRKQRSACSRLFGLTGRELPRLLGNNNNDDDDGGDDVRDVRKRRHPPKVIDFGREISTQKLGDFGRQHGENRTIHRKPFEEGESSLTISEN